MKRRDFLKGAAVMTAGSMVPQMAMSAKKKTTKPEAPADVKPKYPNFTFGANGKFRIMQFTDTHYITGDARSERALKNVQSMIATERPDLVIHTGDIIFGKPAQQCLTEILAPISESGIPFAVALGNHDDEFGMSRLEVYDYIRQMKGCINTPEKGIHGASNDLITLSSADGTVRWAFYLLDTGNRCKDIAIKTYEYLHFDQLAWYRGESLRLREGNGGKPVPSLAFMHIPLLEYTEALRDKSRYLRGNLGEEPCPSLVNSGMFVQMQEMGDIKALFSGHDHDDDYVCKWRDMFLAYGRYSGCDTVYNNLKPNGCRMIEITEGASSIRTYVRLSDGKVEQDLTLPDSFHKD